MITLANIEQAVEDSDGVLHFFMSRLDQIDPFAFLGGPVAALSTNDDLSCRVTLRQVYEGTVVDVQFQVHDEILITADDYDIVYEWENATLFNVVSGRERLKMLTMWRRYGGGFPSANWLRQIATRQGPHPIPRFEIKVATAASVPFGSITVTEESP